MSKAKADKILQEWRERGLKRMAVLDQYKLIQQGYQYCPVCDDIKTLANFEEADNQIGYDSKCKDHRSVSPATASGPKMEDFMPENADQMNQDQLIQHFEGEINKALDSGNTRVPRALISAIKQFDKIHYCPTCRHVGSPRPKEKRERAKKEK